MRAVLAKLDKFEKENAEQLKRFRLVQDWRYTQLYRVLKEMVEDLQSRQNRILEKPLNTLMDYDELRGMVNAYYTRAGEFSERLREHFPSVATTCAIFKDARDPWMKLREVEPTWGEFL